MKNIIDRAVISMRLLKHKKQFNRYDKEWRTTKKESQLIYSRNQAEKELAIIDELEFILNIYGRG